MQWHTPIGYRIKDGKIIVDEEYQKIVKQIYTDYDNGISASRIAINLKANGIPNAKGRMAWTHVAIGKILENYSYLGTEYYPQLIETELFERVQEKREQTRMSLSRGKHRPDAKVRILFGGILTCGVCGIPYSHIQPKKQHRNIDAAKWKCKNYIYHNRLSCAGGFITDHQVIDVCIRAINRIIKNKGLIENIDETEKQVSRRFRELDRIINHADEESVEDMKALLYERASERYRTLEVKDNDYKTEEMLQVLQGRGQTNIFDETLYHKLIRQIVVYKDLTVKVIFHNGSNIKLGYGEKSDLQKGAANGS